MAFSEGFVLGVQALRLHSAFRVFRGSGSGLLGVQGVGSGFQIFV